MVAIPPTSTQLSPIGSTASPSVHSWALQVAVWAARPHCHQSGLRTQEGTQEATCQAQAATSTPSVHRSAPRSPHQDHHQDPHDANSRLQTGGITTIGPRHADDTPPRASYGSNSPHRCITTKVARNFPWSFFETARKRCNSNVLNSIFEILAGELRATLLGNHSGISHRRGRRRPEHQRRHRQGKTPAAPQARHNTRQHRREGHRKAWQRFDEPTDSKQKSHVISLGHFSRPPENVAIPTF